MAWITTDTKDAWQALGNSLESQRPYKGRRVTITKGKYKGQAGVVTWHGVDQYRDTRYLTAADRALDQMVGREGYRIRVQPLVGAAFFCKAEYAEVLTG